MNLSWAVDKQQAIAVIRAALEHGVTFFVRREAIVGEALGLHLIA
jgi:hypothetical protein